MKMKSKVVIVCLLMIFVCTACNGTITRNIRHAGFNVGSTFHCDTFFPQDKEDTSYKKIKYLLGGHIVDENGVIYEISLGQKYANNQNCKKAETNITVEAIMDNQIIKSSNNKYYRLVGQNDVKPYTEVSKIYNNYELIDLLMEQTDVVKVITANSNTGQFYVLKKDGNVHSYIVSKENRNDPIVITSIKKVYDKNDFDSSIVDFSYAGESLGTFVRTEKSVYRMMITNSKTCKKYADVSCEFKMEKDPIFDEYKENIIAYNGVNLITNYNQVFSVAN